MYGTILPLLRAWDNGGEGMRKLTEEAKELMVAMYCDDMKNMRDFVPSKTSKRDIINALNIVTEISRDEPRPVEIFIAGMNYQKKKGDSK